MGRGKNNMKKNAIVEIDSIEQFQEIISAHEPVLVDYYATWCGPCKALAPNIERVAAAHPGALRVLKVDIDAVPELAQRSRVREVPTLHFYRDGRKVGALSGFRTAAALTAELTRYGLISAEAEVSRPELRPLPVLAKSAPSRSWVSRLFGKPGANGATEIPATESPIPATTFRFLETEGQLTAVIDASMTRTTALFLHDPWCPIGARAFREMEQMGTEVATIDVSKQRQLSAEVERRTGVRHASPQVIVLRDAIATWNASHGGVTARNVRAALLAPQAKSSTALNQEDEGR